MSVSRFSAVTLHPMVLLFSPSDGSQNSSYYPPRVGSTSAASVSQVASFSLTVNISNASGRVQGKLHAVMKDFAHLDRRGF